MSGMENSNSVGKIQLTRSAVVFDEASHTYTLDGAVLQGVTSTLVRRAFPRKYDGVDAGMLSAAAEKGKALHEAIQNYDRYGIVPDDGNADRIALYEKKKEVYGMTVIENEYLVSDNERYASSIDIVVQDKYGRVCLIDTKTTYTLDRASVALQLSIYKRFFEQQNGGLVAESLFCLYMPNRDHTVCELHELSPVADDTIDALIEADINDEPFEYQQIPDEYYELEVEYRRAMQLKEFFDRKVESLRGEIMGLMQGNNLQQIRSKYYTVSYIPEKVGNRFDSATFKKENRELYDKYMKESVTAASVRFTEVKKVTEEQ